MLHTTKTIVGFLMLMGTTLLYSNTQVHTYEIEKGVITYDVYGGGVLTPETNLTLRGKAVFRFRDHGQTLLSGGEGIVSTTGALESKHHIESLEKQTKDAVFTVDFANEKIHEHKNSISNTLREHDIKDLNKTGEEVVAGLKCDVWEGHGLRKCLYKGIVLKVESQILGISYHKIATDVSLDVNATSSECKLPDFPKENFALFHSSFKTKNEAKAKCFTDALKDVAYTFEKRSMKKGNHFGVGEQEKTAFLNKIGQKIYEYQKEILPDLLLSMRESRECLYLADNVAKANECMVDMTLIEEQLGRETNNFIVLWDDKSRKEVLDRLEDRIYYLHSRTACIERSKNITDLSACMK